MKMSMLVNTLENAGMAPRLREVRARLEEIIPELEARGMEPVVEKSPLCAAPMYVYRFNYEQGLLRYGLGIEPVRSFGTERSCGRCLLRGACYGLDPGYLELYGENELKAITRIDARSVTVVSADELKKYSPITYRTNLLTIARRGACDAGEIVAQLDRIAAEARKNIAGVFLVPESAVGATLSGSRSVRSD
jgi:hypothetical protein